MIPRPENRRNSKLKSLPGKRLENFSDRSRGDRKKTGEDEEIPEPPLPWPCYK
jgi:hypothetical protein